MNKKILVIIGLAAAIAVSGGVIAVTTADSGHEKTRDTSGSESSYVQTDDSSTDDTDDSQPDASVPVIEDETEHVLPTRQSETVVPSVPFEEQLISAEFTVQYALDHVTGDEVSPRVVFGASYGSCYAWFGDDGRFELCLDPSSGTVRSGDYHIVGNVVSVEYDSGAGAEYDIITDNEGNITYLIVNYGDYDVYFG